MVMQPTQTPITDFPAAVLQDIWKSYGGIPVLKGVNIDLQPGEIHALVGGNGAGKSTLMKIITGVVTPDAGKITIAGNVVRNLSPRAAHANGVYLVPQEPELFPNLTVLENIQLGLGNINVTRAQIVEAVDSLSANINLDHRGSDLSISDQQLVELVRGILRGARLLIVDEPTSALTDREAQQLFTILRDLAASGVGIFYVTHRMAEIFELCDRVTVLRDGALVLQKSTQDTSISELVEAMIPDATIHDVTKPVNTSKDSGGQPILSVRNLTGDGFKNVSFDLYPGEVLGIAGVVGSGRTEVAETIYGVRKGKGDVEVATLKYDRRSATCSLKIGLSYVPEDRHEHGVFLLGSIVDNVSSTVLDRVSKFGVLNQSKDRSLASKMAKSLALQAGSLGRKVANLSGGNQQKVSLAKALTPEPIVLMLDEPSRGIDAAARGDLYRLVEELAANGLAVLLISSEFEEIVLLSSRVLVMNEGQIVQELQGQEVTFENVRDSAFGSPVAEKTA